MVIPKSIWCELFKLIHTLFSPSNLLKEKIVLLRVILFFRIFECCPWFFILGCVGSKRVNCDLPQKFIKKIPKMLSIELRNFLLMLWGFLPSIIFTIIAILNWCSLFIVSLGRFYLILIYKIKDNIWYFSQKANLCNRIN